MGEMNAHPTAIIESGAKIGSDVKIGPYCVVGSDAELADGVELVSHVVVAGRTSVGERTRIFPFASIGHQPQDLKYHGERPHCRSAPTASFARASPSTPAPRAGAW